MENPQGTIHIQTEFSIYPDLKVVTSVVQNGQVLLREVGDWESPLETAGQVKDAELYLIAQHQRIYEKIVQKTVSTSNDNKEQGNESMGQVPQPAESDDTQPMSMLDGPIIAASTAILEKSSPLNPSNRSATAGKLELLLKAINLLCFKTRENLGGYIASRELKRCRDRLINQYHFIASLSVDNSGNCSMLGNSLDVPDDWLVKAFGELASGYFASCAQISPKMGSLSLQEILHDLSHELARIGFWR